MNLALFDLDNTLLPLDSDHQWGEFLVRIGAVDAQLSKQKNDQFYRDYQNGCLDNDAFLAFQLAPFGQYPRSQLDAWHARYMQEVIDPVLRDSAKALVQRHMQAGNLCALVTATNEFVTAPIAERFGFVNLIATSLATKGNKAGADYTGKPQGVPNFREGKVVRTEQWLAGMGMRLSDFPASYFYSDSINDLPLLEKVSHPIATNPDAKLRHIASTRGWQILDLFA